MDAVVDTTIRISEGFVGLAVPLLVQSAAVVCGLVLVDRIIRGRVSIAARYRLWLFGLFGVILPVSVFMPEGVPGANLKSALIAGGWAVFVTTGWLVGVLTVGGAVLRRTMVRCSSVKRAEDAKGPMLDAFNYCRGRMNVSRRVRLKVSDEIVSPTTCGLLRPVIVLPAGLGPRLGSRHVRAVLLRELAQIRRGYTWIRPVRTLLQVICFCNPYVWIAGGFVDRLEKKVADEIVLEAMDLCWYRKTLADAAGLTMSARRLIPELPGPLRA